MITFVDNLSVEDLVDMTKALHRIMPNTIDYAVIGVEKSKEGDANLVLHTTKIGSELETGDKMVMISFDYVEQFFGQCS